MSDTFINRIRLFFPYLIGGQLLFLVGYSLVRLGLFYFTNYPVFLPEYTFIPLFIFTLLYCFWSRPMITKFRRSKQKQSRVHFYLILGLGIFSPFFVCSDLLFNLTQEVHPLNFPSEVDSNTKTLYYSLNNAFAPKELAVKGYSMATSGKHKSELTFTLHVLQPLWDYPTPSPKAAAIGIYMTFKKSVNNSKSKQINQKEFEIFKKEAIQQFNAFSINQTEYRRLQTYEYRSIQPLLNRTSQTPLFSSSLRCIKVLTTSQSSYINTCLGQLCFVLFVSWLITLILLNFSHLQTNTSFRIEQQQRDRRIHSIQKFFKNLLVPSNGYWVTPLLFILGVTYWILAIMQEHGVFTFETYDLYALGGLSYRGIIENEYLRFFSYPFLVPNLYIFLLQVYIIAVLGRPMEAYFGSVQYALILLVYSILGGFLFILFDQTTLLMGYVPFLGIVSGWTLIHERHDLYHNFTHSLQSLLTLPLLAIALVYIAFALEQTLAICLFIPMGIIAGLVERK